MEAKTVLVAGAAGFLGSHLVETLLARGNNVIGLDNFLTGSEKNLAHVARNDQFEFIEHNIANPLKIAGPIDYVFDFACPASPTDFDRLNFEILQATSFGVYNLLDLCREKQAVFVYSSTSEVYGDAEINPQHEEYTGNVNINGRRAIYDEGKRFGESMAMTFMRRFGVQPRIVRIFNTYGERMRADDGRAIPTFIKQALLNEDITLNGTGEQTRSIQYVSDLIAGTMALADSNVTVPVNIGNPAEMTMIELAQMIVRLTGSNSKLVYIPPTEHDPKMRRPDIRRAKELLDWEPKIDPEEGLLRTINWFRHELGV